MSRLTSETRWQLLLLGLCIALRVGALWQFQGDLNSDPDMYLSFARRIAAGHGLSAPGTDPSQPGVSVDVATAFRPPLYPLLLVPVSGEHQQWGRAGLHLALSVLTFLGIWRLGKNLGLSPGQSVLANGLYTFDPLSIRYVAFPMTETVCATLVTLLLVCLTEQRRSAFMAFLTGLVFGMAVLSRPTFWIFGMLFIPVWLWQVRGEAKRVLSIHLALGALGIAICVLPWVIRNVIYLQSPIVMTTHGGYTLLLGNNEAFYREVVHQPWGTIWDGSRGPGQAVWYEQLLKEAATATGLKEVETDRWMSQKAKQTILQHPGSFAKACLIKFCWFWNLGPQGPESKSLNPIILTGIRGYYLVFWGLALIGLMRCLRAMWRGVSGSAVWLRPVLMVVSLSCAHLVYWSDARMRAPITPAVALIAAAALSFKRDRSEINES